MNALTKLKRKQWVNLSALELCVSENNIEKFVRVKAAEELASYEIARVEDTKEIARLRLVETERDEYKRQAKMYNDDMMFVKAQRDELRIKTTRLINCFVVDTECDWWKPNPLTPMSERDTALTELRAALKGE